MTRRAARAVRIERDSLGEVKVPREALYGAQTQRAIENFRLSGQRMPARFIRALALVKQCAARTNCELGLLDEPLARAIEQAAARIAAGDHAAQFPVDVFQTGSGTSTNMNMNEVIATVASKRLGATVHPNDHVNLGQSSNDVIPASLRISAAIACRDQCSPRYRASTRRSSIARALDTVVKTGRTHLMDALPMTFGQELLTWAALLARAATRITGMQAELSELPLGGTAIGTGLNAPADPAGASRYIFRRPAICHCNRWPARPKALPRRTRRCACRVSCARSRRR
ncbi:MAG: lyase family protein [Burkholderiaceae bacterium]